MTLSRDAMLELMAYADGELDGDDAQRVEALIASDDDARRFVASLGTLGGMVEKVYEAPAPAAYDGIADRVMDAIAAEAAPKQGASGEVVELRAVRERRFKLVALAAAALSLAAAFALVARPRSPTGSVAGNSTAPTVSAVSPAPTGPGQKIAVGGGVDLEQVDSTRDVEVYYLPSVAGNASSVMVWIDDKGAPLP